MALDAAAFLGLVEHGEAIPFFFGNIEGSVLHCERLEDALLEELVEAFARNYFDHPAEDVDGKTVVKLGSWLFIKWRSGETPDQFRKVERDCRRAAIDAELRVGILAVLFHRAFVIETRGVAKQIADIDRMGGGDGVEKPFPGGVGSF